jgi:predicted trehalose synthase
MARRSSNGRLDEALASLISSQAAFQANFIALTARMDERFARADERFARIEAELAEIRAILLRHEQILESLPEAIRQKIGFQAP